MNKTKGYSPAYGSRSGEPPKLYKLFLDICFRGLGRKLSLVWEWLKDQTPVSFQFSVQPMDLRQWEVLEKMLRNS